MNPTALLLPFAIPILATAIISAIWPHRPRLLGAVVLAACVLALGLGGWWPAWQWPPSLPAQLPWLLILLLPAMLAGRRWRDGLAFIALIAVLVLSFPWWLQPGARAGTYALLGIAAVLVTWLWGTVLAAAGWWRALTCALLIVSAAGVCLGLAMSMHLLALLLVLLPAAVAALVQRLRGGDDEQQAWLPLLAAVPVVLVANAWMRFVPDPSAGEFLRLVPSLAALGFALAPLPWALWRRERPVVAVTGLILLTLLALGLAAYGYLAEPEQANGYGGYGSYG